MSHISVLTGDKNLRFSTNISLYLCDFKVTHYLILNISEMVPWCQVPLAKQCEVGQSMVMSDWQLLSLIANIPVEISLAVDIIVAQHLTLSLTNKSCSLRTI